MQSADIAAADIGEFYCNNNNNNNNHFIWHTGAVRPVYACRMRIRRTPPPTLQE